MRWMTLAFLSGPPIHPLEFLRGAYVSSTCRRGGWLDAHGAKVFTNGTDHIAADQDGHSGGVWKLFDSNGDRVATLDENLQRIGK